MSVESPPVLHRQDARQLPRTAEGIQPWTTPSIYTKGDDTTAGPLRQAQRPFALNLRGNAWKSSISFQKFCVVLGRSRPLGWKPALGGAPRTSLEEHVASSFHLLQRQQQPQRPVAPNLRALNRGGEDMLVSVGALINRLLPFPEAWSEYPAGFVSRRLRCRVLGRSENGYS